MLVFTLGSGMLVSNVGSIIVGSTIGVVGLLVGAGGVLVAGVVDGAGASERLQPQAASKNARVRLRAIILIFLIDPPDF